jgi:lipopolysaccharide export system permease protein
VSKLHISARNWRELWQSEDPAYQAELQYRLSLPLAVLAFTLVAVPLARSVPRQGIYGRLGIAVLVYLVFMNLQQLGERWMENGVTPHWLGMWWVPALLAMAAVLVLLFDSPRWRVWLRRRRVSA